MKPSRGWSSEREFAMWLQAWKDREARSVSNYPYERHMMRKVAVPVRGLKVMFLTVLLGGLAATIALYWLLSPQR